MSFETMALAERARISRVITDALVGKYPPDGVYENDDARLVVECGGKYVNFEWKNVIPLSVLGDIIENGEVVLDTKPSPRRGKAMHKRRKAND